MSMVVLGFFVNPIFDPSLWLVGVVVLGIFWVWEFAQMMTLEDRLFPGKYDKALWAAAFIVLWPAAPFAFFVWKFARTAERAATAKAAERAA